MDNNTILIDVVEFFVVQSRLGEMEPWRDEREFAGEGEAFDWADYLREDGDTLARVIRRAMRAPRPTRSG